MMWTDKAFGIYMGDAGTVTPLDGYAGDSDSGDFKAHAADMRIDPCSDGETRRSSWLTRAGTSLTDTQVHSAVRG